MCCGNADRISDVANSVQVIDARENARRPHIKSEFPSTEAICDTSPRNRLDSQTKFASELSIERKKEFVGAAMSDDLSEGKKLPADCDDDVDRGRTDTRRI